MVWGLLAAFGWGSADVLGAVSGRRIGSMRTAAIAQSISLVFLYVAVAIIQPDLTLSGSHGLMVVASGVLAGCAYLCLFRALELGPVALVSPIVGAFGAVTIALSLTFLGERVGPVGAVGMAATLLGVVLASADPRAIRAHGFGHLQGGGIPWALGAMVCFGVATFFLGQVAQAIGALPATTFARTGNVCTILVICATQFRTLRRLPRPNLASWAIVAAVGIVDIIGTFSFAVGTSTGAAVSLVTAVSVSFVAIPLAAGLLFFKERPAVSQYVGIAVIVGGLLLLGAAS